MTLEANATPLQRWLKASCISEPVRRCTASERPSQRMWNEASSLRSPSDCAKTVPKPVLLQPLELASSEKQIPQVVVLVRNQKKRQEVLEATRLRPRQVRYQAALRPDCRTSLILSHFLDHRKRL